MASWAELLTLANPGEHVVQLYGVDDQLLTKNASRYLGEGLRRRDGLVVIATPEHTAAIARHLVEEGNGVADEAERAGRLVYLDAAETLERLLHDGHVDAGRFEEVVGGALRHAGARSGSGQVRAFGEMVGLLWSEERYAEAARLEELWNEVLADHACSLYCAYPIDLFDGGVAAELNPIVCSHHRLLAGSGTMLTSGRPRN
ncbi:MAG TPA: MEDS domain-containing protein [Gemmatimonadales bacterium]|nr:MEDS domain-containing protein [Gemmatimonadales bacterium]